MVDAQVLDQGQVLVDGLDAHAAGIGGRAQLDRVALEDQVARVGGMEAGQNLDQRGLAGPVVAHQPEHLALMQLHVHVAQGRHRAKALADVLRLVDHLPLLASRLARGILRAHQPLRALK